MHTKKYNKREILISGMDIQKESMKIKRSKQQINSLGDCAQSTGNKQLKPSSQENDQYQNGSSSQLQDPQFDDDQQIIPSMKQKQRIIRRLEGQQQKRKHRQKIKANKHLFSNNQKYKSRKSLVSVNAMNSSHKKTFASHQKRRVMQSQKGQVPLNIHQNFKKSEFIFKNDRLNGTKLAKRPSNSYKPSFRHSMKSINNSNTQIDTPKQLQYDPNILLKNSNILLKNPNKRYSINHNNQNNQTRDLIGYSSKAIGNLFPLNHQVVNQAVNRPPTIQTKNNSLKIPYRFNF